MFLQARREKMKAKSLVWERNGNHTSYLPSLKTKTEVGTYVINGLTNTFCLDLLRGEKLKSLGILFKSEKEAKETAQKDFEKRVKRCIE